MLTVAIGLAAALIFGSADFFGGMASKRISPLRVTAIGALSGLAVLFAAMPFVGGRWSWSAVLLGGLSGITGAAAISLLYACLALGPMSILSPLTAVVSAFIPLFVGLLRGERFPLIGYLAIGLALAAVVLVGFVPASNDKRKPGDDGWAALVEGMRPTVRAVLMAVGSGLMIGAFLVIIDLTPKTSGLVPLIANRAVNGIIMFSVVGVLAVVARRRARALATSLDPGARGGWRAGLMLAVVVGTIDATANALLLLGLRLGELTVMSVLTALYPAGTIILAAIVLKERIAPLQVLGLVLALIAAAMLAIA